MTKGMSKKVHGPGFKFKVALAAIKGDKTAAELAQEFGVAQSMIFKWKKALLDNGEAVFGKGAQRPEPSAELDKLHATIGRLKVENDFLELVLGRKSR